jgi:hypothetical protein
MATRHAYRKLSVVIVRDPALLSYTADGRWRAVTANMNERPEFDGPPHPANVRLWVEIARWPIVATILDGIQA